MQEKTKHEHFFARNHAKPLKRLHSGPTMEKSPKYHDNHVPRSFKTEPSESPTFPSTLRETVTDSTTPPYLDNSVGDHEQDSDVIISPNKFDAATMSTAPYPYQFPSHSFYNGYSSDPSTMVYNASYNNYLPSPSGSFANPSSSMPFTSYGRYPSPMYYPNNYNQPFF